MALRGREGKERQAADDKSDGRSSMSVEEETNAVFG
jgi:hypothetical protein